MLCPGYGPVPVSVVHSMGGDDMSGMDMSDHGGAGTHNNGAPTHEGMGICPIGAAAAVLGLLNASAVVAYSPIVQLEIQLAPPPVVPRGTIVPTRLPRGPPAPV